ncbi:MAG: glycosyl transferase family 2 [Halobacteriaceae archaeon]
MDYSQERVATLHDFGGADPDTPLGEATVVVPMTEREHAALAAEGVLAGVAAADPGRVVVPLRADAGRAPEVADWLAGFEAPVEVLWCSGERVADLLAEAGLAASGKGRDVWLGIGAALAGDGEYVLLHDADTTTFAPRDLRRLCYPLAGCDFEFSKAYYARVENGRLYGRLCRLFYEPLVAALDPAPVVEYLGAFRYALAGECGLTRELARSVRVEPGWGLEAGLLAEAFGAAGAAGTAQVDLGRYEHDHRAVSGPGGLSTMSEGVAAALFRGLADHGVDPDFGALREAYRETANRFVDAYRADAGFNGLAYDPAAEREQVDAYADSVRQPEGDPRLPAWGETDMEPAAVREAAWEDLADAHDENSNPN